MEALVDRMGNVAVETLLPIIRDPDLTALEKFRRYVNGSIMIKAGSQELITDLIRGWQREENLRIRHKLAAATLDRTAPMILEPIIRQGVAEKTFDTAYPAQTARIIAGIWLGLADSLIMLIAQDADESVIEQVTTLISATTTGIERILGAPEGSLHIDRVEEFVALIRPDKDT
jgi:hypothetical protein